MSQIIKIDSLSSEMKTQLISELSFHPVQTQSRAAKSYSASGKTVCAFVRDDQVDLKENPEKDANLLRIPFQKAVALFGTANDKKTFDTIAIQKREGEELYPHQKSDLLKALTLLNKDRTTTLCLGTGGGKTATSCIATVQIKLLTVVLIQNKLLLSQWVQEFQKFTTAVTHVVMKGKQEAADVYICLMGRYKHIPQEVRDRVGFLIIDESPLLCNQGGVNAMLAFTPKFILALTATPSRSRDGMYDIMRAFVGTNEVVNKQKKNISVTMIKTKYKAEAAPGRIVWAHYIQSLLYNIERNNAIVEGIMEDCTTGEKIMVLTTETKHVALLHQLLEDAGGDVDWLSQKKQSYRNCQILVGNTQKCGVGFDDANFCTDFDGVRISIVWIVSQIGNKEMAEQVIGRARSKQPLVRHVVDNESLANKHWQICRKVYVARGAKIQYIHW